MVMEVSKHSRRWLHNSVNMLNTQNHTLSWVSHVLYTLHHSKAVTKKKKKKYSLHKYLLSTYDPPSTVVGAQETPEWSRRDPGPLRVGDLINTLER